VLLAPPVRAPPLPRSLSLPLAPSHCHWARRRSFSPVSRPHPRRSRPAALPYRAATAPPAPTGRGSMPSTELSHTAAGPPSLFPVFSPMQCRTPGPPCPLFPLRSHHRAVKKKPPATDLGPPLPVFLLRLLRMSPPPSSPIKPVHAIPRSPHHLATRRSSHCGVKSPPPR
jgi:hypothetical protein